ncbi:unnamed protein product [Euphydryas editha]|uniref:C2H2-type domain-containing protein n=1 Tax=Euphydryas editha TaxID=104508 RepID=A0AAU9TG53_EUPED|nr:unnamed protein product [Euphydryas editha]
MDQRVQCPVCTLYLHSGITLESHLDTHPKDQVIKALCNLSAKNTNFGSRTPTPLNSERSYRSRSRTPATDDSGRWNNSHRNSDNERYWRRTPSRTKSTPLSISRNATPDLRIGNITFDNHNSNNVSSHQSQCSDTYTVKSDKTQQTFTSNCQSMVSEFDQHYPYYPEPQEDPEIKFSRSSEYNAQLDNSNNVFSYNMPVVGTGVKLPNAMMPTVPRRGNEFVKIVPKQGNLLVKTNMAGMQYIPPGVKPMHVMMPTTAPFVQKNLQNNMIMTGNLPTSQLLDPKLIAQPLNNQFNQMNPGAFTPGTTVVTQNSQIIYREMVHNIDGKPFISSMPAVLGSPENVTNVAQSSSMYQNVMVVDQFGNASCMYTTPQHVVSKPCAPAFNENGPFMQNVPEKTVPTVVNDANKTLIIEVSPMLSSENINGTDASQNSLPQQRDKPVNKKLEQEKTEPKIESPGPSKGLKILSNIKVEVPVQHHKNMLNTVMDLTGSTDSDYPERSVTPEKILPDSDDRNPSLSNDCTQPSNTSGDSLASNSFSVLKNTSNTEREMSSKSTAVENKLDTEFSDSCPVPDLICNEKPSISPCSELSEQDDSSDRLIISSPIPESSQSYHSPVNNINVEKKLPIKPQRHHPLRLNNIFVKKNKKVLQIKNSKAFSQFTTKPTEQEPQASTSSSKPSEHIAINKTPGVIEKCDAKGKLQTVLIEKNENNNDDENNEFDANTEVQSMDIEPVTPSNVNHSSQYSSSVDMVQVKEEINSSNEFSNGTDRSTDLAPMETLRPINVVNYSNMPGELDDDSNHRELLELEAASKNKQFVSMMNENYFGDNIYADYFTPDRVEAFDAEKESNYVKENAKDGMYIWGESSHKESEFILPNFIHESYKIAESNGMDYSEMGAGEGQMDRDVDRCERDSKADVLSESRSEGEPALNICADERMPPRGELSGQESNGDMESPWSGMYSGVPPAEHYDLMARESWVSDGSDVDANEKTENVIEEQIHFPKTRTYTCAQCCVKFPSLKELRAHKALVHALPGSSSRTSYSRLVTARAIKKEEKPDDHVLTGNLLSLDTKEGMASTMLQVYNAMSETKPQIEGFIKQEPKKRRKGYVCPTCKVDQLSEAAFHAHLKLHPLECLTCGKCFFKRANLALHVKTHLGIKNYKCEVCEKRFITRQKLAEHHNVHTGRAPVKCTLCDDTFRRYSNMVQHRDRHHFKKKTKVRDFVCQCGAVFHSRAKLLWHKETHDEKPKACLYCSDKFVHAASLTRHVRRSHNEYFLSERAEKGRVENVPCPVCKQMYLRSNLRAHLLTHSGKRPYHCIICNKAFTTKWNLKLHRWTHLSRSAKPFKCNLCKGAFIRHTDYVSHMNAHKSVRPYTCNYCGCQFIRKYNCQRHVREHEMAKKYVCKVPECGKSFHRSYYLSEHMKVHSGARPFSCNICGKTSSNKSNHNKHVKIHHAREPVATEA